MTGRVAALNRFISRAIDRCHIFFKVVKKAKNEVDWTPECEEAFLQLKQYMTHSSLLAKPSPGETLYLYLAVSGHAVSSVLVHETDKVQKPMYYVSKALLDAETRYPAHELVVLSLIIAAQKLRPYFQAHTIGVYSDYPLRQILQKPEASVRLTKWTVELSEHDITYHPSSAVKG